MSPVFPCEENSCIRLINRVLVKFLYVTSVFWEREANFRKKQGGQLGRSDKMCGKAS